MSKKKYKRPKPRVSNRPPDRRWPKTESWTPAQAVESRLAMIDYLKGPNGIPYSSAYLSYIQDLGWGISDPGSRSDAEAFRSRYISELETNDTYIWCSESFTELLLASVISFVDGLQDQDRVEPDPEDLLSMRGSLVFQKPVDLSILSHPDFNSSDGDLTRVRQIDWQVASDGFVDIRSYHPVPEEDARVRGASPLGSYLEPGLRESIRNTRLAELKDSKIVYTKGSRLLDRETLIVLLLSGVLASKHVEDSGSATKDYAPTAVPFRRNVGDSDSVRVISLRSVSQGARELEAATNPNPGVRLHWVRGHWRNQWYASVKENRRIWVDGFPRGNPELGKLTGPAVLTV